MRFLPCEKQYTIKLGELDKEKKKLEMDCIYVSKGDIDKDSVDIFSERKFETGVAIGVHVAKKCDRTITKNHNKAICFLQKCCGNFSRDNLERDLCMSM